MIKTINTRLEGVIVLEPKVFQDNRGMFFESYSRKNYQEAGVREEFVQTKQFLRMEGSKPKHLIKKEKLAWKKIKDNMIL